LKNQGPFLLKTDSASPHYVEAIATEMPKKPLGHLAAAGVAGAQE
jgi:hypothetical protein